MYVHNEIHINYISRFKLKLFCETNRNFYMIIYKCCDGCNKLESEWTNIFNEGVACSIFILEVSISHKIVIH